MVGSGTGDGLHARDAASLDGGRVCSKDELGRSGGECRETGDGQVLVVKLRIGEKTFCGLSRINENDH